MATGILADAPARSGACAPDSDGSGTVVHDSIGNATFSPRAGGLLMKRLVPIVWCGTIVLGFLAGYAVGPAGSAAAGQTPAGRAQGAGAAGQQQGPAGALPPGDYSKMQLAPDQGEPTLFSGENLRKAHPELQARAARSQPLSNPRDLMQPLVTRTHSFIL